MVNQTDSTVCGNNAADNPFGHKLHCRDTTCDSDQQAKAIQPNVAAANVANRCFFSGAATSSFRERGLARMAHNPGKAMKKRSRWAPGTEWDEANSSDTGTGKSSSHLVWGT